MTRQRVILLLGPTAVGKSSLLYRHLTDLSLFVLSADSMQVYRNCDVLSATPAPDELEALPHAGINERDPGKEYSVHDFLRRAREVERRLESEDRSLIVIGGTPLYLRAYLFGLDDLPPPDEKYRSRLRREAEERGREHIHERLSEVDPRAAENIHPNDLKRTIRALEIHHQTGRTKTELTSGNRTPRTVLEPLVLGLRRPREELRERIRRRCRKMLNSGIIEEVESLRNSTPSKTLRQAIGYGEVCRYLEGELERNELLEELESNTWEYARKQMTWYRNFPVDRWFHPDHQTEELIESIEHFTQRAAC